MRSLRSAVVVTVLALLFGTTAVAQEAGDAGISEDGYRPEGVEIDGELAIVVDVVDGDTIKVERGNGAESVRYIGIDTPETVDPSEPVQPFGPEATAANEELVGGKWIMLEKDTSEVDRFGRLLRYVWVPTPEGVLSVNNELVRRGLADVKAYEPDTRYHEALAQTLAQAKADGVGMWAGDVKVASLLLPTTKPIDRTMKPFGRNVSYRWLDGREYKCADVIGCWGLVAKSATGCSKRLDVKVAIRDQDGKLVDTVTKSRDRVRKGRPVRFKIVATDDDAYRAQVEMVKCNQKAR